MSCRMCGGELELRMEFEPTPIANDFQDEPNSGEFHPLNLVECKECKHIQTSPVLSINFDRTYKYQTPRAYIPHLKKSAQRLKHLNPEAKVVVEIGCNNGINCETLGEYFDHVIGVDPANTWGLGWPMPFNVETAQKISGKLVNGLGAFPEVTKFPEGKVDLIVANNVFAHIDDLDEVFRGIDQLLSIDGMVSIEVNYFPRLAQGGKFDIVYHEHLDQHTLTPWLSFLEKYNLVLWNYDHLETHGGSVRLLCKRGPAHINFVEMDFDWQHYYNSVIYNVRILQNRVKGKKLILWGATAKATTLIHQTGIKDLICYAVDSTPQKQGKYIPGTDIQILPPSCLDSGDTPVLLGAWNYEKEFKEQYPDRSYITPY